MAERNQPAYQERQTPFLWKPCWIPIFVYTPFAARPLRWPIVLRTECRWYRSLTHNCSRILVWSVIKALFKTNNYKALEQFLFPLEIGSFDPDAAIAYGGIRSLLDSKGKPVGSLDPLIAAQAQRIAIVLVTNKERECSCILELSIENWPAWKISICFTGKSGLKRVSNSRAT